MNWLSIRLQNCLSHSDSTIALTDDGLYLLVGRNVDTGRSNGAGKSGICDGFSWCVFGRGRIPGAGDEMIKDGEDEMSVTVLFEHAGRIYCVVRTRKRNKSTKLTIDEVDNE